MSVSATPINHTTEQRHLPRNERTFATIFKKMSSGTRRRRRSRRPNNEEQPRFQFMNLTHPEEAKTPAFMRTVRQRVMWNVADRREGQSQEQPGTHLLPPDAHRDQKPHPSPPHSTSPGVDSGVGHSPGISDSGISAGGSASTGTDPLQDLNEEYRTLNVQGLFQRLPEPVNDIPDIVQPPIDTEAHSRAIRAVDPYADDVDETIDRSDDSPNALVQRPNLKKLLQNSSQHFELFNWDRLQHEPYINHFTWLANWSKVQPAKNLLSALGSPSLSAALSRSTTNHAKPPHTVVSSIFLKSLHLDITTNASRESYDSCLLKTNVLHDVAERIGKGNRPNDSTILSILHLVGYELIVGDESTLAIHEAGLTTAVQNRGYIEGLRSKKPLGTSITAMISMSTIFRESQPDPMYLSFIEAEYPYDGSWNSETSAPERESYPLFMHPVYGEYWSLLDSLWHNEDPAPQPFNIPKRTIPFKILESPIYCPGNSFLVIKDLPICSHRTYQVVRDMRDMTDEFLSFHDASHTSDQQSISNPTRKMRSILDRIQERPSAQVSSYDTFMAGADIDWIYEATRLTALLYAYALYHRVPFSEARRRLEITHSSPIPEAISLAIRNQGVCDMWGELGGVRLWCCMVGGAAARQIPGEGEDNKRMLAREWLALGAVRCSVILAFYSTRSVMGGLRRLLKVQEILGMPAATSSMNWTGTV